MKSFRSKLYLTLGTRRRKEIFILSYGRQVTIGQFLRFKEEKKFKIYLSLEMLRIIALELLNFGALAIDARLALACNYNQLPSALNHQEFEALVIQLPLGAGFVDLYF